MNYIAKLLIKIALFILPLTPNSYKMIMPIMDKWVDKLNDKWWKPNQLTKTK